MFTRVESSESGTVGHLGIGDVGARTQQLLVAHDQLGIELVAWLEQQVAPDNPFAGQQWVLLPAR